MSLNQLALASGVNKGYLSLMENGRMIPTAAEYDAITAALKGVANRLPGASSGSDVPGAFPVPESAGAGQQ